MSTDHFVKTPATIAIASSGAMQHVHTEEQAMAAKVFFAYDLDPDRRAVPNAFLELPAEPDGEAEKGREPPAEPDGDGESRCEPPVETAEEAECPRDPPSTRRWRISSRRRMRLLLSIVAASGARSRTRRRAA